MKKPRTLRRIGRWHLWRATTAVCVVYAGLFAGYAAAYLLLIEREYPRRNALHCLFTAGEPEPRYGVGGTTVQRVFAPAHSLDRRLRPDYWSVKPPFPFPFARQGRAARGESSPPCPFYRFGDGDRDFRYMNWRSGSADGNF